MKRCSGLALAIVLGALIGASACGRTEPQPSLVGDKGSGAAGGELEAEDAVQAAEAREVEAPSAPAPAPALLALGPSLPPFAVAQLEDTAHPGALEDLAWSAKGETLAGVSAAGVGLWDVRSWQQRAWISAPAPAGERAPRRIALSDDAGRVLVSEGNFVAVHDGDSGDRLAKLEHEGPVLALAASSDAELIVSGGADGLRTWNGAGQARARLEQDGAQVEQLQLSADAKRLACVWSDGRVRVLDPSKKRLRVARTLDETLEASARSIALSRDGARLALPISEAMAGLYELSSGELAARLPYPRVLDLDQGGNLMLVVASLDGGREVAQLVDVHAGEAVRDFGGPDDTLQRARFAPNGLLFATLSAEGNALIFAAP